MIDLLLSFDWYTFLFGDDRYLHSSILGGLALATLGSAVIGGIASIFNTSSTNSSNAKSVRETNSANLRINQLNNEYNANEAVKNRNWQEQMYNKMFANADYMTQKYNTPAAQAASYRDAGLNPALMMNGASGSAMNIGGVPSGSTASASSTPSMQAAHYEPIDYSSLSSPIIEALKMANNQSSVEADVRKSNAEAEGIEIENQTKNTRNLEALENLKADTKSKGIQNAINVVEQTIKEQTLDAAIARPALENSALEAQANVNNMQAAYADVQANIGRLNLKNIPEQFRQEMALMRANIQELYSRGLVNKEQAKLYAEQQLKTSAETYGMHIDNRTRSAINKATLNGLRWSNRERAWNEAGMRQDYGASAGWFENGSWWSKTINEAVRPLRGVMAPLRFGRGSK